MVNIEFYKNLDKVDQEKLKERFVLYAKYHEGILYSNWKEMPFDNWLETTPLHILKRFIK